eukprot:12876229-Alexandrium_andersonii.AAC.1
MILLPSRRQYSTPYYLPRELRCTHNAGTSLVTLTSTTEPACAIKPPRTQDFTALFWGTCNASVAQERCGSCKALRPCGP